MNRLSFTRSFLEAARAAARELTPDATEGVAIPKLDGYFIVPSGKMHNGDRILLTIREGDREFDIYGPHAENEAED